MQKHTILKWIFYLSALIGAITTIVNVPKGVYSIIDARLEENRQHYNLVENLDIGMNIEYVKSILGQPVSTQICESPQAVRDDWNDCYFPKTSEKKLTYDQENYFLDLYIDQNNTIVAFTITIRSNSFTPSIEMFLGRFEGYGNLKLGKTAFADLDFVQANGFLRSIEYPIVGNNFAGYAELFYSDDYAVDHFFVVSSSESALWSKNYVDTDCDYYLLENYQPEEDYEDRKKRFKQNCTIQSISILDKNNLGDNYIELSSDQIDIILEEQTQYQLLRY